MLRNLFVTAVRSLLKNKFFSLINILGLSIGMAVFLLIAQYTSFERSYENFIPGKENIYRVKLETFNNNELILNSAENYPGVGPALKEEFPEVLRFARLYNQGYKNNVIITNTNAKPDPIAFKQKRFQYADSSFLPMMGYEMVKGNAATALKDPFTAVISETYARLYFPKEDPIGKTLLLQDDDGNNELVKVTGVFKDLPENTHMKFDVLFSYQTLYTRYQQAPQRYFTGWFRKDMYVFVQLRPGTDPAKMETRFPALVKKYKPQQQAQASQKDVISLQPIADIHLRSDLAEEVEANGNERIVFFMGMIGLFVLVIAWINYVNLSTARALERAKEVGIRKVVGAIKAQLINQFLVESAFVNLVSALLAWGMVALILPFFNTLSGQSLTIFNLFESWFLLLLVGLWLVSTVLSGFYPALVLSSFKPVTVLKGKLKNNVRGIVLRKGLVVMQFMASIALIAGTMVVYRQLNYMMNRDLGLNIDQVMVIERPGIQDTSGARNRSNIDAFRNELKSNPAITAISASLTVPGKQREYKLLIKNSGANSRDSAIMRVNIADYEFVDAFKMKVIAGRNFSRDFPKDLDTGCMITESASRLLGFKKPEDAINQPVRIPQFGFNALVTGVINDYHQVSLKKPLDPTFFILDPYGGEFYSIRISTTDLPATIDHVRQSWSKAFRGNPFEYFFLDDYFNNQYANERKFGKLFTVFAVLAIFIGCLGLFGLSAYTASQRIKEIGIRKVLGASVTDITSMLSRDFIKLVGIAILIATPIAWYVMHNWLQEFAYRTNIAWWIFAVAGLSALFIALITVSFQAIKAALSNPVKSLRTE